VPPAALAAIGCFAVREVDPVAAAEGVYLGKLAAGVLVAVAALAPEPARELGLGAALATAAVWSLPAGPGRGAVLMALLVAAFTVAAVRRLRMQWPSHPASSTLTPAVALCFGAQILLRGELLFSLRPTAMPTMTVAALAAAARPWLALLVLPVIAGTATAMLWRRYGALPAWVAAGAAMALAPGWTVGTTLAVVALAGAATLVNAPAGTRVAWGRAGAPRLELAGALAALLASIAWEPRSGWVATVAGLALWRPPGERSWPWTWARLAAATLLALAVPWVPDRSVLAAPLALAALALPSMGAAVGIAAVWGAAVVLGTALLASYPWMRVDPLGDCLALLGAGGQPGWRLAATIGAAALAVGAVSLFLGMSRRRADRTARRPANEETARRATGGAAAVAGLALFAALAVPRMLYPGTTFLTAGDTVLLERGNPEWRREIGTGRARSVVLQTSLLHAAELATGTPVALVRLRATGSSDVEMVLRAGRDSGEWAARRPDLAGARLTAPRAWMSWVAGDFFGQRYRSRLAIPSQGSFGRLEIELAPGLPPDFALALYQVELDP
jgi:hypothetical protein